MLLHSGNLFLSILKNDVSCVYAASGLGTVLARAGWVEQALPIFHKAWEALPSVYSTWHNLALINLAVGKQGHAADVMRRGGRRCSCVIGGSQCAPEVQLAEL